MSTKKIKNNTENTILVLGQSIASNAYYTLDQLEEIKYLKDLSFKNLVENDTVILNVNNNDLTKIQSLEYLEGSIIVPKNIALGLENATEPNTNNFFITKNYIDNVKNNLESTRFYSVLFYSNGNNISNKWLNSQANIHSNNTSMIIPVNVKLTSICFNNSTSNISCDIEIYKNGTTQNEKIYILEIRNKQTYWKILNDTEINFDVGNQVSCYVKYVGTKPSDIIISLNFIIISLPTESGGF